MALMFEGSNQKLYTEKKHQDFNIHLVFIKPFYHL